MASYRDLLDAIARVGAVTGSPDAWKDGMTGADVAVACNPMSPPGAVDAVLAKLTTTHPSVFGPAGDLPPPVRAEGATADAIRSAESALARQRSDAAQVDLQVLTAVVNAHATAAEGRAQLSALQREIETAVASRTDLDTPAGARELQRFLIGAARDIRNVLTNVGLEADSKAALADALAALYASSTPEVSDRDPTASPEQPTGTTEHRGRPAVTDTEADTADLPATPRVDGGELRLPDYLATDLAALDPSALSPVAAPAMPVMPPFGGAMPAAAPSGAVPAAAPSGGMPLGTPFGAGLSSAPWGSPGLSGTPWPGLSPGGMNAADPMGHDALAADVPSPTSDPPDVPEGRDTTTPTGDDESFADAHTTPTPVLLPDGQTVMAPSPELASVITAAVAGAPIPTAFGWQGITIPAPGSPVVAPVDPARLVPGDIAVLADRHALALGNGTALLDNQIQPISNVTGSGFIGWQHPPKPDPTNPPAVLPPPDRSAATAPS